ncbi:MAG: hypothetical protein CVU62_06640 [Deltaproteobacteria bacterium HGW-Deltaproteobacteria-2]|nr:MAG: hypothetical protein CVU62_06640 [Deltaproteobacteria bacterium HGW-Deltaproteobacteria-2]
MKTTFINIRMAVLRSLAGSFALLVLLAFVLPQAAQAATAANTVIRNTVTVNFKDTAGTSMTAVTDTVDITVELVYATATLSAPGDGTTDPNTAEVYNYTITSNANGPDTYALSAAVTTDGTNTTGSTAATSVASVTLGATTVAAAVSSSTTITVPSDGTSDSSINGIEDEDTVVIGGAEYHVDSITDNATGTSTIVLLTAVTASAGDGIFERKTFTTTVTPGTIAAGATADQTIYVTTTADGGGTPASATDETITTVYIAKITVDKKVNDAKTTSCNGSWMDTQTSVKFKKDDYVCYRVTVTNSGSSAVNTVVITDPQPPYTTYEAGTARLAASGTGNSYGGTTLTDSNAADDGYDYNITTGNTVTYSVSTLAAGASVELFYIFKVN